jgi:hypothetical protein
VKVKVKEELTVVKFLPADVEALHGVFTVGVVEDDLVLNQLVEILQLFVLWLVPFHLV